MSPPSHSCFTALEPSILATTFLPAHSLGSLTETDSLTAASVSDSLCSILPASAFLQSRPALCFAHRQIIYVTSQSFARYPVRFWYAETILRGIAWALVKFGSVLLSVLDS